jgi:hypothetical protein
MQITRSLFQTSHDYVCLYHSPRSLSQPLMLPILEILCAVYVHHEEALRFTLNADCFVLLIPPGQVEENFGCRAFSFVFGA